MQVVFLFLLDCGNDGGAPHASRMARVMPGRIGALCGGALNDRGRAHEHLQHHAVLPRAFPGHLPFHHRRRLTVIDTQPVFATAPRQHWATSSSRSGAVQTGRLGRECGNNVSDPRARPIALPPSFRWWSVCAARRRPRFMLLLNRLRAPGVPIAVGLVLTLRRR